MSFSNQFSPYTESCQYSNIINPLTVPFMNSVNSSYDSKYKSPINVTNSYMARTEQNSSKYKDFAGVTIKSKYYINNATNNNENFVSSSKSTSKKSNDFALAWTCVERNDGTFYCPLRGDKY